MITKENLKKICIYLRHDIELQKWKREVNYSKELGIPHIAYAPHCSLEQYAGNICAIKKGEIWKIIGYRSYNNEEWSQITNMISKFLGV